MVFFKCSPSFLLMFLIIRFKFIVSLMCMTFYLMIKCVLEFIFMPFYTYNVLGIEMSPFRWNGSFVSAVCSYSDLFRLIHVKYKPMRHRI